MSESPQTPAPDPWWLLAGPVAGVVGGSFLGASVGWLTTPTEGVGPLVGDPVGSTILGAVVGVTVGVLAGSVVGAVLMFMIGRTRPASTARPLAAAVAALCCPAVLLVLASIGRVELGQLGAAPFVLVGVVGAAAFAWLAGRTPGRDMERTPA